VSAKTAAKRIIDTKSRGEPALCLKILRKPVFRSRSSSFRSAHSQNQIHYEISGLETALKDVLVFAKDELTEEEKKEAKRLMILVQQAIHRR
jgi:hypothetical protein